jgi:large subunit ribosomal protein L10
MRTKQEKEKILKDLTEKFNSANGYLLVSLINLKTSNQNKIRSILKENNGLFQVVKKTLIYKANPNFPFNDEQLKLPFALIWNFDNNLSSFQALKKLAKEGINLEIISGYAEGKILSKDEALAIINLPSKEELMSKVVQNIKGLMYKMDYTLQFPLKKLIFILSQIKK